MKKIQVLCAGNWCLHVQIHEKQLLQHTQGMINVLVNEGGNIEAD